MDSSRYALGRLSQGRLSSSSHGGTSSNIFEPNCQCCGESYSGKFSRRILLSCLHPICAACLRLSLDLLVSLRKEGSPSNEDDDLGAFLCPFCHCETKIGPEEISLLNGETEDKSAIRPLNKSQRLFELPSPDEEHSNLSSKALVEYKRDHVRHSTILRNALEELLNRRRVIHRAIEATEDRKRAAVDLANRGEADLLLGRRTTTGAGIEAMRKAKLRTMNKILERLCVLRQSLGDIDFLCALLVRLFSGEGEIDLSQLPALAKRLAQVGDVLNRLSPLPSLADMQNAIEWKTAATPGKVCLDLTAPLYEKVLCQIPFALFDSKGGRLRSVSQDDICASVIFSDFSCQRVSIIFADEDFGEGSSFLRFVPPCPGEARVSFQYSGRNGDLRPKSLPTFPNVFIVRELTLDDNEDMKPENMPRCTFESELFAL